MIREAIGDAVVPLILCGILALLLICAEIKNRWGRPL